MIETHRHSDFPLARVLEEKGDSIVSVVVAAKDCASTVAGVIEPLITLREAGALDEVIVVEGGSKDATARVAASAGADVVDEATLMPEFGPVLGKGDAMWRSLTRTRGDLLAFVDGDTTGFAARFALGLIGPLLADPGLAFVKGAYRRPFVVDGATLPDGGGRVSQLTARPLLTMFWPELAELRQPLAGEIAARRSLLERLPFATGYAVETAMLIDALREVGVEAIAECDLGERRNAHQTLHSLVPMAWAVVNVVRDRLERDGRLSGVRPATLMVPQGDGVIERGFELVERPALASLPALS